MDAEHVVILMQENRSFDHAYGSLQGVRGFNDPRAIRLPNNNKVWLQTNKKGETYAPFRLNIKDTKATWMGSLPHSWTDQVDARNNGKYDQWLEAKKSGNKDYKDMPLTLGYYNREDLPFYYSLADSFTVCDQNFCSSLTGTTPNRLYLWTGTIRDEQNDQSTARVRNSQLDYDLPASWKTFPERLEENNIPWKIYQNEISVGVGFEGEEDAWLANFTDNPIEWFTQYHVQFLPAYIKFIPKKIELLKSEINKITTQLSALKGDEEIKTKKQIAYLEKSLQITLEEQKKYTLENYNKLSEKDKNLHTKAFTTNVNDPDYHNLTSIKYKEGTEEREVQIPKGDVFHQFRKDVKNNKLPTVSWLVAPENFSDHPGAPWYGAWYVSETMDILTQNPEVWKKTIFILCYDENDGYFDHVPPFVSPNPNDPKTGKVSSNIDASVEYVTLEQDSKQRPAAEARESSIGLGYRVPLVIASPWSRGGIVNSQVCDHTSILMFLEKFLSHKTGKKINETNISSWRRAVCSDLTSVFQPYNGEKIPLPEFLPKDDFIGDIHQAKFKKDPSGYKPLTATETDAVNRSASTSQLMPQQEKGVRQANPLPYQLYAEAKLNANKNAIDIHLASSNSAFGERTAGSPFYIYGSKNSSPRYYAISAGDQLSDQWAISDFDSNNYQLSIYGPNGFFREFKGSNNDPQISVNCEYELIKNTLTGNIVVEITNNSASALKLNIRDNAYKASIPSKTIEPGKRIAIPLNLVKSFNWYDFTVAIEGNSSFEKRYAGHVETGKMSSTDPLMGGIL